jgi:outer membrane protein OmpA-like peptidoglycan-associated protein
VTTRSSARRHLSALILALAGGCAAQPPAPLPAPPPVATAAIAPAEQPAVDQALAAMIRQQAAEAGQPWLQAVVRDDGLPSLSLADAAFAGDSGELRAAALLPLARLATRLVASPAIVIHLIGERLGDGPTPASDLGERRAAAVAAVLRQFGVPPVRLRFESHPVPGHAGGVAMVLRPIVAGHQEQAYRPPAVTEGS